MRVSEQLLKITTAKMVEVLTSCKLIFFCPKGGNRGGDGSRGQGGPPGYPGIACGCHKMISTGVLRLGSLITNKRKNSGQLTVDINELVVQGSTMMNIQGSKKRANADNHGCDIWD